jgi:dsRNA-specific ribonuclease
MAFWLGQRGINEKAANRKRCFLENAVFAALQNKCTDEIPYYIRAKSYADFFEAMIGAAYIVASTTAAYQVLKVRRNGLGTDPDWCLLIDGFK